MKWIGITGGIATGKSTVSKMIQDLGAVVIDADQLSREVVQPGSFGLQAISSNFGPDVITSMGELDRKKLAEIIFKDEIKRARLENLLHPLIQWRSQQERDILERRGLPFAFYDATLIFEKGLQYKFNGVIVVTADPEVQKKRLIERNKITAEEAEKRIAAQWPMTKKVQLANFVIDNSGSVAQTKAQVEKILKQI
jgi:dephospho-CoA kinase